MYIVFYFYEVRLEFNYYDFLAYKNKGIPNYIAMATPLKT